MKRREFILGSIVPFVILSGCVEGDRDGGIRGPPIADRKSPKLLRVDTFDTNVTKDGKLLVETTIMNEGNSVRRTKLTIRVESNGTVEEKLQVVEIEPNEETITEMVFQIDFESFENDGDLRIFLE